MSTNKNAVPFDLRSMLNMIKDEVSNSFNCHGVGTIESFDSAAQTAQVSLNYKKLINGKEANYPILIDCPVIILTGGQAALTLPVMAGDTCLILFNDVSIDDWFNGGQVVVPTLPRQHSFSDAIALVGLRSTQNPITSYDSSHAKLSWGQTEIGISATQARIANAADTLNSVLQDLVMDTNNLLTLLTVFMTGLTPGTVAAKGAAAAASLATVSASLAVTSTKISGLLE